MRRFLMIGGVLSGLFASACGAALMVLPPYQPAQVVAGVALIWLGYSTIVDNAPSRLRRDF